MLQYSAHDSTIPIILNSIFIKIVRGDGKIICMTNNDYDVFLDGEVYFCNKSIAMGAVENNTSLLVNYISVKVALGGDFTRTSIMSGAYDNAKVNIFTLKCDNIIDMNHNSVVNLKSGFIGRVEIEGAKCCIEVRSIKQYLSNRIENRYSKTCRATFGDVKCRMDKTKYMISNILVTEIKDAVTFTIDLTAAVMPEAIAHLNNIDLHKIIESGSVVAESPGASTAIIPILKYANSNVTILRQAQQGINIGAIIGILLACDKTFNVCCSIFDNAKNFRGEPYIDSIEHHKCRKYNISL